MVMRERIIRKLLTFNFLRTILGDPFGIQNPKYREIILKWFAL